MVNPSASTCGKPRKRKQINTSVHTVNGRTMRSRKIPDPNLFKTKPVKRANLINERQSRLPGEDAVRKYDLIFER